MYLKVAQMLARHSTIALTMDRYTRTVWEQLIDALGRLPDLSGPTQHGLRATGTDGHVDAAQSLALYLAPKGTESLRPVHFGAVKADDDGLRAKHNKAR